MVETYWQSKEKDKTFLDLKDDDDFIRDSVVFLMSDRRNFSTEDINDMSREDVVYEIMEHKRQTSSAGNDISQLKDISFIKNDTHKNQEARDAYSRISLAWDGHEKAGDSFVNKTGDYIGGLAGSPTVIGGALAAPLTMGSGFIAAQAAKSGGMALFNSLVKKRLMKNMLITGGIEGVAAGGKEYMAQTVQNESEDRLGVEYKGDMVNVPLIGEVREDTLKKTAVSAGLGLGIGTAATGVFGHLVNRGAKRTFETLEEGYKVTKAATKEGLKNATIKIANTDSKILNAVEKRLSALDPERVAEGIKIKDAILGKYSDTSSAVIKDFNASELQRIAAATIEIAEELGVKATKGFSLKSGIKVGEDESTLRITDKIADLLEGEALEGSTFGAINKIKDKYQLSNRQLSAIFASEFSQAGRILAVASKISRSQANDEINRLTDSAIRIANNNVAAPTKEEIKNLQSVLDATESKGLLSKVYRGARGLTDSRVAFMTSQVATTARNTTFGGMYMMLDVMDSAFASALKVRDLDSLGKVFTQPLKVINRLAFNRTEAEAAVYQLSEVFPDDIRRLLSKQGMIEAEAGSTVQNSAVMRLATKANFLNAFSDNQFKRAVLIGNLDRRLAEAGNAEIGTSVREVLKKNTWNKIDKNMFLKSVDEAYNKSFQTQFGLKGEGYASQTTGAVIKGIKNSVVGTLVIPFPRFIASQAKFIAEYTPFYSIVGRPFISAGSKKVINPVTGKAIPQAASSSSWEENLSKELTGGIILGAGYLKAHHGVPLGYEWNEIENPSNKSKINAQPTLGPMALQFWAMDKFYRLRHGMNLPKAEQMQREMRQLLIGADLRAQNSLTEVIDGVSEYASKGDPNKLAKAFTDIGASFTYPAAVLKDVYGQLDPRSAYLPETKDATVNVLDFMGIEQKTIMRATRFLPDIPQIDIPTSLGGKTTGAEQQRISKTQKGYDPFRYDIFTEHALYIKDPILKQFLGTEMQPEKSMLDREFTRLALDKYSLYRTYQVKNDYLDTLTRMYGSTYLPKKINNWIKTDKNYNNPEFGPKNQRTMLSNYIKNEISTLTTSIKDFFESTVEGTKDEDMVLYLRGTLKDTRLFTPEVVRNLEGNYGSTLTEKLAEAKEKGKETEFMFLFKAVQDARKMKKILSSMGKE